MGAVLVTAGLGCGGDMFGTEAVDAGGGGLDAPIASVLDDAGGASMGTADARAEDARSERVDPPPHEAGAPDVSREASPDASPGPEPDAAAPVDAGEGDDARTHVCSAAACDVGCSPPATAGCCLPSGVCGCQEESPSIGPCR